MVHFSAPEEYTVGYNAILSKDDTRKIKAYCQRNEQLPKLLANRRHVADSLENELRHFPTLFAAARQSPRMACNTILIGLLTVDEVLL
jgi:hypothetical protein